MAPKVVGAGLGRTGTTSLKLALERLLGGECYHMATVRERPEDAEVWARAYAGERPDWTELLGGCCASVDWPASPFWAEQAAAFPDAVILLSERDPDSWWTSASNTIWHPIAAAHSDDAPDDGSTHMLRG